MNKNNSRLLLLIVLAVVVGLCLCNGKRFSGYQEQQKSGFMGNNVSSDDGLQPANADGSNARINLDIGCAMNSGVGLASSLLPREVASQEDFGQFAPDDILSAQNFLDPRQQIGFPETIGGALRNANQQIRADPPNPKQPYTWNNSTIVPDLMQRRICT
jgi:hypothetical protein